MYFMVFAGQRDGAGDGLRWTSPVGVFEADKAEDACQAAAKKVGWMGSYFAIEGYPWGVEMIESEAREFGVPGNEEADRLKNRIRELERSTGVADE